MRQFPIYKGLQKPLSYKGLKGKFIGWGAAALGGGLVLGGLSGALINMYLGAVTAITSILAMFALILYQQKKGLHSKQRCRGIFIHPSRIKIIYGHKKQNL
jgi:hypothetical protein